MSNYGVIARLIVGWMVIVPAYFGGAFAYQAANIHLSESVYVTYTAALVGAAVLGSLTLGLLFFLGNMAEMGNRFSRAVAGVVHLLLAAIAPLYALNWVFTTTSTDGLRYVAVLFAIYATWKTRALLRDFA